MTLNCSADSPQNIYQMPITDVALLQGKQLILWLRFRAISVSLSEQSARPHHIWQNTAPVASLSLISPTLDATSLQQKAGNSKHMNLFLYEMFPGPNKLHSQT
jgi:hypothetical protein